MARKVDWGRIGLAFFAALCVYMSYLLWGAFIRSQIPTPTKPPAVKTAPVKKELTPEQKIDHIFRYIYRKEKEEAEFEDWLAQGRLPAVRATGGKR